MKADGKANPADLGTKNMTTEEFQIQCSLNKIFFGDGEVSIDLLAHERLDAGKSGHDDMEVLLENDEPEEEKNPTIFEIESDDETINSIEEHPNETGRCKTAWSPERSLRCGTR